MDISDLIADLITEDPDLTLEPISKKKLDVWLKKAVPVFVLRFMSMARSVKVCSSISPAFAAISRVFKIPAYIVSEPGHMFNVVLTDEGPIKVDLSAIQFKLCKVAKQFESDKRDRFGEKRATRKLLQQMESDPLNNIIIEPFDGSIDALDKPSPDAIYPFEVDEFMELKRAIRSGDRSFLGDD